MIAEKVKAALTRCQEELEQLMQCNVYVNYTATSRTSAEVVAIYGVTLTDIEAAVLDECNISPEQVRSKCRKRELVFARQLYCFLARSFTLITFEKLAEKFSQDHTSAISSVNKYKDHLSVNDYVAVEKLAAVKKRLFHEA